MKLDGQVAIVTGAGSGQGRATSLVFAQEGASVVVGDIDLDAANETAHAIAELGGAAEPVRVDVTVADQVAALVRAAVERFGSLSILVNNAGVNHFATVDQMTEEAWDRVLDTNLKSIYLGCHFGVPALRENGGGSIVNVASISGLMGQRAHVAYCAAKAGVINMTKALALDHGSDGIRVNCICPGAVYTPMLAQVIDAEDSAKIKALEDQHPLGRIADPEEIARVSLFLSSQDASFMTGSIVLVDGGLAAGTPGPPRASVEIVGEVGGVTA
jgi:NAD(P)-dependent dehydrogenase (short-subunit alcohol dehydrogenase family)